MWIYMNQKLWVAINHKAPNLRYIVVAIDTTDTKPHRALPPGSEIDMRDVVYEFFT